jgi:hypothetical protein
MLVRVKRPFDGPAGAGPSGVREPRPAPRPVERGHGPYARAGARGTCRRHLTQTTIRVAEIDERVVGKLSEDLVALARCQWPVFGPRWWPGLDPVLRSTPPHRASCPPGPSTVGPAWRPATARTTHRNAPPRPQHWPASPPPVAGHQPAANESTATAPEPWQLRPRSHRCRR